MATDTDMCMTIQDTACVRTSGSEMVRHRVASFPYGAPVTRLSPETYLSYLRSESARFREVLAACDPEARVPACPDWNAADLLWHLATVQRWWAVGFILRRQAHEALIHRVDAEQAAGVPSDVDPALASDGVHEVLAVMYGGCPPWGAGEPGG